MDDKMDHAALIDRLAAGEIDESLRRDLFTWLDGEPARWRRCALALLEARELEDALGAWQNQTSKPAVQLARPPAAGFLRPSGLFALAASVMVAFCLGIFARGFFVASAPEIAEAAPSDRHAPATTVEEKPAGARLKSPRTESRQHPTAVAAAPSSEKQSDRIPPYVRSQLERRGYQVSSHPAQLPVVLPDGRRVMVPVDQFQLNYVGQRTY
jgi:hypothetical protein